MHMVANASESIATGDSVDGVTLHGKVCAATQECSGEGTADRSTDPRDPVAFEELLVPLVAVGRADVQRRAGSAYDIVAARAHGVLERSLLVRLSEVCGLALYSAFSVHRAMRGATGLGGLSERVPPRRVYEDFVAAMHAGGLTRFRAEHPVAARLCNRVLELWVDSTVEMLSRVEADGPALDAAFGGGLPLGQVIGLTVGAGDTHDGGRSVMILRFAGGTRVVYKPRPIGIELQFAEFAARLNAEPDLPVPLTVLTYVARTTHGWIEFVTRSSCANETDVRAFYTRAGVLLAVVYALGGHDVHRENVIAAGASPVLIDMETLIRHGLDTTSLTDQGFLALAEARDRVHASVLQTGVLPLRWLGSGNQVVDAGVLGGAEVPVTGTVPCWTHANTDWMKHGRRATTLPLSPCVPEIDTVRRPATEYVQEIIDGFRRTYHVILASRECLLGDQFFARMGAASVRFIFRPTNLYASLLAKGNHPTNLKSDAARRTMLDVLAEPLWKLRGRPGLTEILEAERAALEQMDVPCFHARADSTALELPTGVTVPAFFDRPAIDETRRRVASLSGADCEWQVTLIRAALDAVRAPTLRPPHPEGHTPAPAASWSETDALNTAVRIARAVEHAACRRTGAPPGWIGMQYSPLLRGHVVGALPVTLFSGSAGIALFLVAVDAVTGTRRFSGTALDAMAPVRELARQLGQPGACADEQLRFHYSRHVGAAEGVAGAAYALGHLSRLLDRSELMTEAHRLALLVTPDRLQTHPSFAAIDGIAGAVLCLLALDRLQANDEVRACAVACGVPLLTFAQVVAGLPEAARAELPSGLAQGATGVALALGRLYRATGDTRWINAARETLALDAHLVTREAPVDASWHAGACGYLMAQTEILGSTNARERTLSQLRGSMWAGGDSATHGALGCADALLVSARGDAATLAEARAIGAAVARRAAADGGFALGWSESYFHLGLYEGMCGVGYTMLRLARPDFLPCVLCWE